MTECDSPITLVNATFQWINDNLKESVDFVVWTGDSARHDSDERISRTEKEVLELNEMLVAKFVEVFGKEDNINDTDPTNDMRIPIIPTFGNNDIMPHNILAPGPNRWTKHFSGVWKKLIPEEQKHSFERGGWFYVEVIPNQLAVFSLNTLYFFDSNTAVDGCAGKEEPGYEQMEWLRIQLKFLRKRGMKAILTGHIPPARTESKLSWDETCWQKYSLWVQQYRDVVVGSLYGHMNIDHFMLQDFKDISSKTLKGRQAASTSRVALGDEMTIQTKDEYLTELRTGWSQLPEEPDSKSESNSGYFYDMIEALLRRKKHKKSKKDKYLEKIGGPWGESYSVSLVSPSVVPNYFPTLRVIEYNISGIDTWASLPFEEYDGVDVEEGKGSADADDILENKSIHAENKRNKKKSKGKKKKHHKKKKPKFTVPKPPSKSAPPGPAYSPQTFSWLGYTQYYANLTRINKGLIASNMNDAVEVQEEWQEGKHNDKKARKGKSEKHPASFKFEVEYDTRNDTIWRLRDLTVRSYIDLARRIGQYKPAKSDEMSDKLSEGDSGKESEKRTDEYGADDSVEASKNKKYRKKHPHKHKHRKAINKVWFTFVRRAFVGTKNDDDLHEDFGDTV